MRRFLFAATLLTSGCRLMTEPVERLDLELSLSTTHVHADTGVVIRLTATNWHWQTVHLRTVGGCVVGYRLIAPEGDDLPLLGIGCPLRLEELEEIDLAPGEAVVREYVFLPRPRFSSFQLERWPSGRYQVVGYLMDEHLNIVKETDPAAFDLVCRDAAWNEC